MNQVEKRLNVIEDLLKTREKRGSRLCWIRWDPNSSYGYDIEDAREDIEWMIYEIKRLQEENAELRSFADMFRETVEKEVGPA